MPIRITDLIGQRPAGARRYLPLLLVVVAVLCAFDSLGLFRGVDNYLYDLAFRLRGERPAPDRILIVEINSETLEKYGRWPIPRRHYAELLARAGDAAAVAFDIIMAEPSPDDDMLAEAIRRHGRVVLPVYFTGRMSALFPVGSITGARLGHVHLEEGMDGVVRTVHHQLVGKDLSLLSFSARIAELSGEPLDAEKGPTVSRFVDSIVQTDLMGINYLGGPGTIRRIPLQNLLGGRDTRSLNGQIVLVGVTAAGLGTEVLTPFSQDRRPMAGVEVQANILATLLSGNVIHEVPLVLRWSFACIVALACFLLLMNVSERVAFAAASGLLLTGTILSYILFARSSLWVSPTIFYAVIMATLVVGHVSRLGQSVMLLDEAYDRMVSRLRWRRESHRDEGGRKGFKGILTSRGIHAKIGILRSAEDQLLIEKELAEGALFAETHGVLLFAADGRCLMANRRAAEMSKANDLRLDTVESFLATLHPFLIEEAGEELIRSTAAETWGDRVSTLMLPKPQRLFFNVNVSRIDMSDGPYLLIVLSDITRIKELEMLKGFLVSAVSHEIKTPMTSIQGFSDILSRQLEGDQRRYAEIIQRQARSLVRFLDNFLDISRIEEGRQPFVRTMVQLQEIVDEVFTDLAPLADAKQIGLRQEAPAHPLLCLVDRDVTRQCVMNLIENAVKYSPSGSEIIVRLREEQGRIALDVTDRGRGIAGEHLERIFDKFYRVPVTDDNAVRGSGLGLAFVKEAVEAQGGAVSVRSRIGEGSTFTVVFPPASEVEPLEEARSGS